MRIGPSFFNMAEDIKRFVTNLPIWYWVLIFLSFVLLVAGFIVPPLGIIDGSVLIGIGELLGFSALGLLPGIASTISIKKGDASIDVTTKKINNKIKE